VAQGRSPAAEARGALARWLGRGAGRRRPGGSSSASSCAEPGEGGEVRHWPPLPLEQEDKDGEGVDDRWALYYCS